MNTALLAQILTNQQLIFERSTLGSTTSSQAEKGKGSIFGIRKDPYSSSISNNLYNYGEDLEVKL